MFLSRASIFSIENPKGSKRSGISPNGEPWEITSPEHYGYIRGTVGKDKDHIDAYIGPDQESRKVFIVDQVDPDTGKFDEHKVILGADSLDKARQIYLDGFGDNSGPRRMGSIKELDIDQFKRWLDEGDTTKSFAPQWFKFKPIEREANTPEVRENKGNLSETGQIGGENPAGSGGGIYLSGVETGGDAPGPTGQAPPAVRPVAPGGSAKTDVEANVQKIKKAIEKYIPGGLKVVQSADELPPEHIEAARQEMAERGIDGDPLKSIKGFYDKGTIYLVADNLRNAGEIDATMRHEAGHAITAAFHDSTAARQFFRNLYLARKNEIGKGITDPAKQAKAAEEWFVEKVATGKYGKQGGLSAWFNKYADKFRRWLRSKGRSIGASNSEIADMVSWYNDVIAGKGKEGINVGKEGQEPSFRLRDSEKADVVIKLRAESDIDKIAAAHYGIPENKLTDDLVGAMVQTQLHNPTEQWILSHFSNKIEIDTILKPEFQGTGKPGREWYGRKQQFGDTGPNRIHFYPRGMTPEAQFRNLPLHRSIINSGDIYDLSKDPDGYGKMQSSSGPPLRDNIVELEHKLKEDGYIGLNSGPDTVTVLFDPVRTHRMTDFIYCLSPVSAPECIWMLEHAGNQKAADNLKWYTDAQARGDFNGMLKRLRHDIIDTIGKNPLVDVVDVKGIEGRWEDLPPVFSVQVHVKAANAEIAKGELARLLKDNAQLAGFLSEYHRPAYDDVVNRDTIPQGVPCYQAPSIILSFDKGISSEKMQEFYRDLNNNGLPGSSFDREGKNLILHHIVETDTNGNPVSGATKYEFMEAVGAAVKDFIGREENNGLLKGRQSYWFKHDVLSNDWDTYRKGEQYDRSIEMAQKLFGELQINPASGSPGGRKGNNAPEVGWEKHLFDNPRTERADDWWRENQGKGRGDSDTGKDGSRFRLESEEEPSGLRMERESSSQPPNADSPTVRPFTGTTGKAKFKVASGVDRLDRKNPQQIAQDATSASATTSKGEVIGNQRLLNRGKSENADAARENIGKPVEVRQATEGSEVGSSGDLQQSRRETGGASRETGSGIKPAARPAVPGGMGRADVEAVVERTKGNLEKFIPGRVKVVQSADDLPPESRESARREMSERGITGDPLESMQGLYHKGTIYLVADNLAGGRDIRAAIRHEAGHAIAAAFHDSLPAQQFFRNLYLARKNEIGKGGTDPKAQAEAAEKWFVEIVARGKYGEGSGIFGLFNKYTYKFRHWMRDNLGWSDGASNSEIVDMVSRYRDKMSGIANTSKGSYTKDSTPKFSLKGKIDEQKAARSETEGSRTEAPGSRSLSLQRSAIHELRQSWANRIGDAESSGPYERRSGGDGSGVRLLADGREAKDVNQRILPSQADADKFNIAAPDVGPIDKEDPQQIAQDATGASALTTHEEVNKNHEVYDADASRAARPSNSKPDGEIPGDRLYDLKPEEIRDIAKEMGINPGLKSKPELIAEIREKLRQQGQEAIALPSVPSKGVMFYLLKGSCKERSNEPRPEGNAESAVGSKPVEARLSETRETEAAKTDRLVELLKASITSGCDRGRILSDLSELAVNLIGRGHDTFKSFSAEVKARLGDLHDSAKSSLILAFKRARKALDDDLGQIGNKPLEGDKGLYDLTAMGHMGKAKVGLKRIKSQSEIAAELQVSARNHFTEKGSEPGNLDDPVVREDVKRIKVEEIYYEITTNSENGTHWFATMESLIEMVAEQYPQLKYDRVARLAFILAHAVTSQMRDVKSNHHLAMAQFKVFIETGRFRLHGRGVADESMKNNFAKINKLLDRYGADVLEKFANTLFTVSELKNAGWKISGELVGTVVYGSYILGPKIGAYFQNLTGNLLALTIDRWIVRSIMRSSGSLCKASPEDIRAYRKELINAVLANPTEGGINWLAIKPSREFTRETGIAEFTRENLKDLEVAEHLATRILTVSKTLCREEKAKLQDESGNLKKLNVVVAAGRLLNDAKPRDVPTAKQRQQFRELFADIQKTLREEKGIYLTIGEIHGILWCLEKRLYGKMGGNPKFAKEITYADVRAETSKPKGGDYEKTKEIYQPPEILGQAGRRGGRDNDGGGDRQGGGELGSPDGEGTAPTLGAEGKEEFLKKERELNFPGEVDSGGGGPGASNTKKQKISRRRRGSGQKKGAFY